MLRRDYDTRSPCPHALKGRHSGSERVVIALADVYRVGHAPITPVPSDVLDVTIHLVEPRPKDDELPGIAGELREPTREMHRLIAARVSSALLPLTSNGRTPSMGEHRSHNGRSVNG